MSDLSRREVLSAGAALALLGGLAGSDRLFAAERPALPIPPEVRADAAGEIALKAQPGQQTFFPGMVTPTQGINGPYLGPAVRVRRGEKVTMSVTNGLTDDITMHWHGLKIPGHDDGGPYNAIKPGGTWTPTLSIEQPAATCWFHPHFYPTTAEQVIMGLAGLFIIDDEESVALGLPSRWGVDDIPLILQDRRFNADGSFFHRFNLMAVTMGYVGDKMLVNGAHYPVAQTAQGWIRLRLLNGSNARGYRLALSDDRSFYVVASDGGLLEAPVSLKELMLAAGERYEILVDARDGKAFDLVTRPVTQLGMNLPPFHEEVPLVTLRPNAAEGTGQLPDALVKLPALVDDLPAVSQNLVMDMLRDEEGMGAVKASGLMKMDMSGTFDTNVAAAVTKMIVEGPAFSLKDQLSSNAVNGASFEMGVVPYGAALQKELRWKISEGNDRMLHPVHIHGCQYRIRSLDGKPPAPHMAGWKDTVPISGGGSCEIQVRFDHPAAKETPFMAHCHILEHEDSGMMTSFSVG
ncbi:MAG TPA: multicopper oxidase CueO [Kiloniellaceae bacterium]|nr:multicopper oxidase CueO [Kiloniellaceae bacterium]